MQERYPVIAGAESFFLKGNRIGLLLSHGFMGTPQSVEYLGKEFSDLGYTVYAPRLAGHGTDYRDLENATYEDWFAELEKGYKLLKENCSTIFVMGQSMGGTLALWLGSKYKDIKGIVLINPALTLPSYEKWIGVSNPRYLDESAPDIKAENVHEITYSKVPIQSIHQLQALMGRTPELLPLINHPLLCFKSAVDHVVPPENTVYIFDHVTSVEKEIVTLQNSYHVASLDNDRDQIILHTHRYIQEELNERVKKTS
ncbi:alpha/beta hydrolase [Robertmurraya kyonggiensis]|uniref:Alpha/beta fold hydrolase n=1 Tax=Robertmurraya kyonggiensis TaxID=1037680 RepID=A0A4U1D271_9BACI|nr:alpha/beta fold hydrolase [Robertmurraya kyonggiensis]TKC16409.1 alpha/beta fold hydrolase [Robertmurraya kyonggiensis]